MFQPFMTALAQMAAMAVLMMTIQKMMDFKELKTDFRIFVQVKGFK